MNILIFDEIKEMQENLLGKIEDVTKGVPLFKSKRMVKTSKNSEIKYPVDVLVDNAIESCKNELIYKSRDLVTIIDEIEKIKEQMQQIDDSKKNESLKNKQKGRLQKQIESQKETLEPEKRLELEQEFHRIYAIFYAKIAWVTNRLAHEEYSEFWSKKQTNMWKAFSHSLMGDMENFNIRLDDDGIRCLDTGILAPIPGMEKDISLHFGSEKNYQDFLEQADEFLSTQALMRPELAYRAKLKLRYKHKQSDLTREEEIPQENKEPIKGSGTERIQLLVIKYIDLEHRLKKIKKKKSIQDNVKSRNNIKEYLLSQCERNPKVKKVLLKIVEQTPTLNQDEDMYIHGLTNEMNKILEIDSKKDIIELLTTNPDSVSLIKNRYNNSEINSLLQIVEEFNECKYAEKKDSIEKLLIYRCVGMGTEGEDTFFKTDEEGIEPVEQIRYFLSSLGIIEPDLEEQIRKAFAEKEKLKEQGYDLGKQTLTQNDFIDILKQFMIKQEKTFDDIDVVMDCYKELDMFYGKDENRVISRIKNIIDEIIYGDSKRVDFNELFEYTCDNNIDVFFEGLKKIVGEQKANADRIRDKNLDPTLSPDAASEPTVVAATNRFGAEIEVSKKENSSHDEQGEE